MPLRTLFTKAVFQGLGYIFRLNAKIEGALSGIAWTQWGAQSKKDFSWFQDFFTNLSLLQTFLERREVPTKERNNSPVFCLNL